MKTPPSHYKKLNDKQLRILKITYKYRFITAPLLASYLNLQSRQTTYLTLERLADQGYLLRRKNDNTNFSNKGTRFALANKSLKLLSELLNANQQVLHARYKDRYSSEGFITHSVTVFKACQLIRTVYPDIFTIYTKYEVYGQSYFPETLPDIYLNRTEPAKDIFIDILDNEQFFLIKKRLSKYLEHYETGDWGRETKRLYPTLLFVCIDARIEKKLQDQIENLFDNNGIDEIRIYTTTVKSMTHLDVHNAEIWTNALKPSEIVGLDKL